jgi:hypothetical protein
MRAALNSESYWVKTNIFELVELNEAQKFFIGLQIDDILFLFVRLKRVLEYNLGVTQIIADRWKVSLILVKHVSLPHNDVCILTGVKGPHGLWQLGL